MLLGFPLVSCRLDAPIMVRSNVFEEFAFDRSIRYVIEPLSTDPEIFEKNSRGESVQVPVIDCDIGGLKVDTNRRSTSLAGCRECHATHPGPEY